MNTLERRTFVDCPSCLQRQPASLTRPTWAACVAGDRAAEENGIEWPRSFTYGTCVVCGVAGPQVTLTVGPAHPVTRCDDACWNAESKLCRCPCRGANHGTGKPVASVKVAPRDLEALRLIEARARTVHQ